MVVREIDTVHMIVKPFEAVCKTPISAQPEPGTWENVTCIECLETYIQCLEDRKKWCYQYISGDTVKLVDPEILSDLNQKIEYLHSILERLD